MNRTKNDHRGFTIMEMLVVIGIITILLAMLLPALSGVQNRARKNTEVTHLRQVHLAWMSYANDNNDAAMPGYLDEDVQTRWRIRVDFPYPPEDIDVDDPDIPDDPGTGADAGSSLAPGGGVLARQGFEWRPGDPDETGATWTWRLLPYLDYAFDLVLGYDDAAERDARALVQRRHFVARHPAFGYNGLYIGGRWEIRDGRPQYFFTNAREETSEGGSEGPRVNLVSRTVSQIQRSSEVVIFSSSRRVATPQLVRTPNDIEPGYHMVTPPVVGDELQWGHDGDADPSEGHGDLRFITTFASPSLVPIGRYNGLVPTLRADGSTEVNRPMSLFDQRLWIDVARTRDFMHTLEDGDAEFAEFP